MTEDIVEWCNMIIYKVQTEQWKWFFQDLLTCIFHNFPSPFMSTFHVFPAPLNGMDIEHVRLSYTYGH